MRGETDHSGVTIFAAQNRRVGFKVDFVRLPHDLETLDGDICEVAKAEANQVQHDGVANDRMRRQRVHDGMLWLRGAFVI